MGILKQIPKPEFGVPDPSSRALEFEFVQDLKVRISSFPLDRDASPIRLFGGALSYRSEIDLREKNEF